MSQNLNHKARISRAIKNNLPLDSAFSLFRKSKFITITMLVVSPFYPTLASIGVDSVARGYYDESSIIAYEDTDNSIESTIAASGLVSLDTKEAVGSTPEEIDHVPTAVPPQKQDQSPDTEKDNQKQKTATGTTEEIKQEEKQKEPTNAKLQVYTVQEHDDVNKIAKKYKIAAEVILWQNGVKMSDTLKVGQKLKIPAKSGIIYTIKKGNTLSEIAKIYKVSSQNIMAANGITNATKIRIGQKILLPGVKPKPKPKPAPRRQQPKTKKSAYIREAQSAPTATVNPSTGLKSSYRIKFTGRGRGMAYGNCTYHVARNKTVTWRGNANRWMRNARAQWKPTGRIPVPWAIIQFTGHGYSPRYGHVGIVRSVHANHIIITDMNYGGFNKVTWRKIMKNDPAIDGYIYVD